MGEGTTNRVDTSASLQANEVKMESGAESSEQKEALSATEEALQVQASSDVESAILTFEELSKWQFGFSSGAGGWEDVFTVEKDGFFTGKYHDSDMGDIGEGYDKGTRYSSSYSGHFKGLEKLDAYTYKLTLSDITYKEETGTQEILDGIRYVYTDAYALGNNDTFLVYLPGTPVSCFSEEVWVWLRDHNGSETELTMPVLVDEKNGYGIYSYERMTPLEDARVNYEAYKESYAHYTQMASEGTTTMEIREYTAAMYDVSDECLNYLWNLVRYNVEEEEFEKILAEQRQWIAEKEEKADAAEAEWEGGTFAPIIYLDTKAEMTMQRCEELLQYMEENLK